MTKVSIYRLRWQMALKNKKSKCYMNTQDSVRDPFQNMLMFFLWVALQIPLYNTYLSFLRGNYYVKKNSYTLILKS